MRKMKKSILSIVCFVAAIAAIALFTGTTYQLLTVAAKQGKFPF